MRSALNPIAQVFAENDLNVNVVHRLRLILEVFAADATPRGLSAIQRETGLAKATAYRLASDLVAIGLLAQDPADKRYRLGALAVRLGRNARDDRDLRTLARPHLQTLAAITGETILLMTPDASRTGAVCIEQISSRQGLRIVSEIGERMPLHAGGASKAILAFMAPEEIDRVLGGPLAKIARRTKTDAAQLRTDLTRARRQGYAPSIDETYDGAAGLGVPVFDADARVIASVAVVGPSSRMSDAADRWLDDVRATAERISAEFAGREGGSR